MGRAEVLFGNKVHLWPQPRTASHYVAGPECDLSSHGLSLDSITGEITGTLTGKENETEPVSISCPVMAVQSTDEGLTFNATATIRAVPFSFGSAVLFVSEGDLDPPELHTKLSYLKGSLSLTCTPSLPWLDVDALKDGKIQVKSKGAAVGGVGGGVDGTEAAEASMGELVDEAGDAGAAAGVALDSQQSARCTATYTRVVKRLPGGGTETAPDSIDVLLVRYEKWGGIAYPDLPTPFSLYLTAGQSLPPTAKELLPEDADYSVHRKTFFRASKPAYFTVACGIRGASKGSEGTTSHNMQTGEVRFATSDGSASVRLFDLNAHSGLIGGYTGYVQGEFNDLKPTWNAAARRYVIPLECRVFGRDLADALSELKGGASSQSADKEWVVSKKINVEIADAYCWQDSLVLAKKLFPLSNHDVSGAPDHWARHAICLRRCVDDPTCALTGVETVGALHFCVVYRVAADTAASPSVPCQKESQWCVRVWTKMKDCTSENTCRQVEVLGSASLSGTYCPIIDDLKTGLPLMAAAGMTPEDSVYMVPNMPGRDPGNQCPGMPWILRRANPGGDFVDKASSDFELSGKVLGCLPAASGSGHKARVVAREYIDINAEISEDDADPNGIFVRSEVFQEDQRGAVNVGGAGWAMKFTPRLCPNPMSLAASKGSPNPEDADAQKQEKEETSPDGGGQVEIDLMTGGTGAFRFFSYASGEDLWIDPCDCIPDSFGANTSPPQVDPAQMAQKPSNGNLMDAASAPDVLISAKGDLCPLANMIARDPIVTVMDEAACSAQCRSRIDCRFFFTATAAGSQVCMMFSRCDALLTHVARLTDVGTENSGKLYGVPTQHVCLVANPEECHNASKRRKLTTGTRTDAKHTFFLGDWLTKSLAGVLPKQLTEIQGFGKEIARAFRDLHQSHTQAARDMASVFAQESAAERQFERKYGNSQRLGGKEKGSLISSLLEEEGEDVFDSAFKDQQTAEAWGESAPQDLSFPSQKSSQGSFNRSGTLLESVASFLAQRDRRTAADVQEEMEDEDSDEDDEDADLDIFPPGSEARAAAIRARLLFEKTGSSFGAASLVKKASVKVTRVHASARKNPSPAHAVNSTHAPLSFLDLGTGRSSVSSLSLSAELEGDAMEMDMESLNFLVGQKGGESEEFWMQMFQMGKASEKLLPNGHGGGAVNLTLLEQNKLNEIATHIHRFVKSSSMAKHFSDSERAYSEIEGNLEKPFKEQINEFVDVLKGTWEFLCTLPDALLASNGLVGFITTILQVKKLFVDIMRLFALLARGGVELVARDFGSKLDSTVLKVQNKMAINFPRTSLKVRAIPLHVKESIEMAVGVFYKKLLDSPVKEIAMEILDGWIGFQRALVNAIRATKDIFRPFFDGLDWSDFAGISKRIQTAVDRMNDVPKAAVAFTESVFALKDEEVDLDTVFSTVSEALQFFMRLLTFPDNPDEDVLYLISWAHNVRAMAEALVEKHADIVSEGQVTTDSSCLFERLLMECEHKSLLDQLKLPTLGSCGRCTLKKRDPRTAYSSAPASLPRMEYASGTMLRVSCRDERYVMVKKQFGVGLKGLAFDMSCVDGNWVDADGAPGLSQAECAAIVEVGKPNLASLKASAKEHLYFMNALPVALYTETSSRDFAGLVAGGNSVPGLSDDGAGGLFSALVGISGVMPPPFPVSPLFLKVARSNTRFGLVNEDGQCLTTSPAAGYLRTDLAEGRVCDFDSENAEATASDGLFDSKSFEGAFLGALENVQRIGAADAYHAEPVLSTNLFDSELSNSPTVSQELNAMGEVISLLQGPTQTRTTRGARRLSQGPGTPLGGSLEALPAEVLLQTSLDARRQNESRSFLGFSDYTFLAHEQQKAHTDRHSGGHTGFLSEQMQNRMRAVGLLRLGALQRRKEFQALMEKARKLQDSSGNFMISASAKREIEESMHGMSGSLIKKGLIEGGIPASVVNAYRGQQIKQALSEQLGLDLGGDARFESLFHRVAEGLNEIRDLQANLLAEGEEAGQEEVRKANRTDVTGPVRKVEAKKMRDVRKTGEERHIDRAILCSLRNWTPDDWEEVRRLVASCSSFLLCVVVFWFVATWHKARPEVFTSDVRFVRLF
uniref:Apple domain-containing protein n=1 Tax=Chromera velia CCMP2878 TaxID=1169474 RepID=A0A0G4HDE3_9ALVE|eukprot:Cvel_937.t1-p1 / transcript=Cvel_937.t1 / gene=Cvel_937 / organism=Chromera_velia_CCMP2878 / gene_product=hypothetical protein / transcript_product=hypothetical protein / location=Cvel_scaffold30:8194-21325(+) / protein_length=2096 / sequence_SO=supercontig / SO=protein_coding / is_pseudo=false